MTASSESYSDYTGDSWTFVFDISSLISSYSVLNFNLDIRDSNSNSWTDTFTISTY